MNRSFGGYRGWVSSFYHHLLGCFKKGYCHLCVLNPDSPVTSIAFVANSRFVPASLPVGHQK